MLADIEAATSDVHILIFGFKAGDDRQPLPRPAGPEGRARAWRSGSSSRPRSASRAAARRRSTARSSTAASRSSPTRARSSTSTGCSGSGDIDWRFDDFGHFDHRKIVVIDGRVAFVGGPGHRGPLRRRQFHDVMLRLEGPIVAQLQAVFLLSWHFQGGPLPDSAADLDRFFPPRRRGRRDPARAAHEQPGRAPSADRARLPRGGRRRPAPALRRQPVPRRPRRSCAGSSRPAGAAWTSG